MSFERDGPDSDLILALLPLLHAAAFVLLPCSSNLNREPDEQFALEKSNLVFLFSD